MELGVSSTNVAVVHAWYDKVSLLLPPGTDRNDVIRILKQFAPVATQNQGRIANDGFVELTSLQVCWFHENTISFLLYYSKNDLLEEIRIDPSD